MDAAKRYPNQVEQIERLNRQIRGGTSVVIALVFFGYLYVANVGDSRAVLCQQENPVAPIRVRQLSEDHTLANEREVARLVALGLSRNWLQQRGRLGPCEITRCIGDYRIKGGYSEMVEIRWVVAWRVGVLVLCVGCIFSVFVLLLQCICAK